MASTKHIDGVNLHKTHISDRITLSPSSCCDGSTVQISDDLNSKDLNWTHDPDASCDDAGYSTTNSDSASSPLDPVLRDAVAVVVGKHIVHCSSLPHCALHDDGGGVDVDGAVAVDDSLKALNCCHSILHHVRDSAVSMRIDVVHVPAVCYCYCCCSVSALWRRKRVPFC